MRRLLDWWPALPAALILYLGLGSFIEKYPDFSDRRHSRADFAGGPDTLLALARAAGTASEAATHSGTRDNPFRTGAAIPGKGHGRRPPAPPPPRHYLLRGTVGSGVATIINAAGQKLILKVGDAVDSAVVISIAPNSVVLKDRGGTFELMTEK
jgi:hypothetical protein